MFIMVRGDLTPAQKTVQAAHAVAEFIFHNANMDSVEHWVAMYKTMVVLNGTPEEITEARVRAFMNGIEYREFREPDMNNTVTAIAFEPVTADVKIFNKYNLAT